MSLISRWKSRFKPFAFKIPKEPFGIGDTERCIEIPWAMSCYQGEQKALDVGYANAEERYLKEILSLQIPQLYGLDRIKKDVAGIIPAVADIRQTGFPEGFFDLVFCISTIEHIGRDNTIYFQEGNPIDDSGDFKAIRELSRITRNKGHIALTVPYGKFHDYGWFIHYDEMRLMKLIEASGCDVLRQDFFIYRDGWHHCRRNSLREILYKDNNAAAAAGLVCLLFEK
jgi:hypothetical protein